MNKKILQALAWLVLIIGLIAAGCAFGQSIEFRPALTAQAPAWGVGRVGTVWCVESGEDYQVYSRNASLKPEAFSAVTDVYLSERCAGNVMAEYMLDEYVEGESPVPEWYRPDEEMAVEWVASYRQVTETNTNNDCAGYEPVSAASEQVTAHPPVGIDPGGVDWNVCSTLYGANGLKMEQWEMGLFARILYREFWGTSRECCIAGADSIINLWKSGYYGNSLFDTLSAVTESGGYAFSTFPGVWQVSYDPDGLAEMQSICEDRFYNGTEYGAAFFRTDHYHGDWAVPLFCFPDDNVYFSTGKGWN